MTGANGRRGGHAEGLPDFIDPADVRETSWEAAQLWGEERPATSTHSRSQQSDSSTAPETGRSSGARRGAGASATSSRRSSGQRGKRQLTWAEKRERKEKRAAKRAEAEAQERRRDPMGHAREIVLTQLTAAPKSRAQLEKKLADRDVEPDVAEAVLDRMEDVGLVNDSELAVMIVRSQVAGRGLARRALRQELSKKGITGQDAELALEQVSDDDERIRARHLVDKKLRTMSRLDEETKKRRLIGFLGRKGYSGSVAWAVIQDALGEERCEMDDG